MDLLYLQMLDAHLNIITYHKEFFAMSELTDVADIILKIAPVVITLLVAIVIWFLKRLVVNLDNVVATVQKQSNAITRIETVLAMHFQHNQHGTLPQELRFTTTPKASGCDVMPKPINLKRQVL